VALGDTEPYREWVARSTPSAGLRLVVRAFIFELHDEPWATPSVPVPELSNQPEDEMRYATLVVGNESVSVYYRHFYGSGDVDLIAVMDAP
jgi:hypothetical protein